MYQQRLHANPVSFSQLDKTQNLQYQKVLLKGQYLDELTIYLQNQYHKDRLGYDVLTPIKIKNDNKLLLVDRGWLPEQIQPTIHEIPRTSRGTLISGYLKSFNEYQFILGKNILNDTFPLLIQKINFSELEKMTHETFYPYVLRLDSTQPDGFTRDWTVVTVTPERHMGYAIQWFLMAIVLLIAYVCFCCERIQNEKTI